MKRRFKLIRLPLIIVVAFFCTTSALACTCADLTVTQQRENANAVFSGTVVQKTRSDAVEKDGVKITFKVGRVWKGEVGQEINVFTGATGDLYPFENLCAPPFRVGQNYIVFALGSDKLTTDVCAGTIAVSDGKATIKELGKSSRPMTKTKMSGRRMRVTTTTDVTSCFRRNLY